MARIVTCPCGSPLAVDRAGAWRLSHRHRVWTLLPGVELADVVAHVVCEACGVQTDSSALNVHEYRPRLAGAVA